LHWESIQVPRLALLASFVIVHCITATSLGLSSKVMAQTTSKTRATVKGSIPNEKPQAALTPAASDMRDAILEAVHLGRLEDLRPAIELNELKPDFGAASGTDPVQHLKSLSHDGTGTDILTILSSLLDSPRKSTPTGQDAENNLVYEWPAFAEQPLSNLNTEDTALLERTVRPSELHIMRASNRYTGWVLRIGADGVWHSFTRRN
jgi:hypothetical protein